jgi:hypothetical protein
VIKSGTLERQIRAVEGFDIRITLSGGNAVPSNRRFEPYLKLFSKGAKQTWTVQEWESRRFYSHYEDLGVSVLDGGGNKVVRSTILRNVRESYYE